MPQSTRNRLLEGAFAVVEGEPAAVRHARGLARTLGMRTVALAAGSKPYYHAAAALAANLTHVLVVTAAAQLTVLGFPPRLARRALAPLVASSMAAALAAEGMENLTGPLGRGDAGAVRAHLAALPPAVAAAYRAVAGLAIAARASEGLLNERRESEMHAALTG